MPSESMIPVASTSTSTLASGAVMLTITTMISPPVPTATESRAAKIVEWAVPAGIAGIFGIVIVISLVGCILRCFADRRAAREWNRQKELLPTAKAQNRSVQSFVGIRAAPAAYSPIPKPPAMNTTGSAAPIPSLSNDPSLPQFPLPPASSRAASGNSSTRNSTDSLLRDSYDQPRSDAMPQIYVSGPGTNFSTNYGNSNVSVLPQVMNPQDRSSRHSYRASVHTSPASSENGSDGSRSGRSRSSTPNGSARYYYPESATYKTYDGQHGDQVPMLGGAKDLNGQGIRRNFGPDGSLRR